MDPSANSAPTLVSRFAEAVLKYGDRTAILTLERAWTYAELDAWSDSIAQRVNAQIGPGPAQVALLFDQGAAGVAATMAVLKAGKCYVALEPSHPPKRSGDLFAFAEASLLIAQSGLEADASVIAGVGGLTLSLDPSDLVVDHALPSIVNENDAAYIFFTSGSTGTPKGVVDSHRNVLHNIHRYTTALNIQVGDRLTMIQSPTFSGTVSSLFCALLNGATLLPYDFRNQGFAALADWLKRSEATIYHSVPSILRGVVESGGRQPSVRVVRLEGDGATRKDFELFCGAFNEECVLAHGLGATETGLSCHYQVRAGAVFTGDRLPIGTALPDMEVLVVDDAGHTVPQGTIGEIEVRSEFLATGYWRDPALAQQRFKPAGGGLRAYRSGDLGFVNETGSLVHMGRKDLEHKISGQWVNTTQVEDALRALGEFKHVLVITRQDGDNEARLVAYVVPSDDKPGSPSRWRVQLLAELPDHMVPRHFVMLDHLPITEHGKVDRRALPPPGAGPVEQRMEVPTSDQERDMALIWQQVLGVARVSPKDDFFDLGGMSIDGLRILAQINKRWNIDVKLADLYRAPTVRALVVEMAARAAKPELKHLVAMRATGVAIPVVCVFGDDANHRLPKLLPQQHPFFAIFHQGVDGSSIEHTSIAAMAERYVRELEQTIPSGPVVLIGYSFGGYVALEVAQRLAAKGRSVPLLVLLDTNGPEHKPAASILKWRLLRLRDAYHRWKCTRCLRQGKPIPVELRTFHIMDTYSKARRHYAPKPWRDPVLLIRSQAEEGRPSGWGNICPQLRTVVVPGDHLSIVRSGRVEAVAQHIAEALRGLEMTKG